MHHKNVAYQAVHSWLVYMFFLANNHAL